MGFRLYWRWKSRSPAGRDKDSGRDPAPDPRGEAGQSTMARTGHSWRTAQARHSGHAVYGCQIHMAKGGRGQTRVSRELHACQDR